MKMLNVVTLTLLTLSGVLAQRSGYEVIFVTNPICAVSGFNVSLPCNYSYPSLDKVTMVHWCFNMTEDINCVDPPYVYSSTSNGSQDYAYTGNYIRDCSLLIRNVRFNQSGRYKFRFITNRDKWTGPELTLQVEALELSLIRLSGNGSLNEGDSVNLTCQLNCSMASSSMFFWSKDNKPLQESGPVLHLPALTVKDSGTYTCTLKSNYTWGSKSIDLQVRSPLVHWSLLNLSWLIVGLILIALIIAAVIYKKRKKVEAPESNSGKFGEKTQVEKATCTKSQPSQGPELGEEDEITYASVSIHSNKPAKKHVHTEQKEEDDSVIYSAVKLR